MAEEKQRELRVVMFPGLANGHITPFLELAKSLGSHGLKIFFVSTPLNIKRINPQAFELPGLDLLELGTLPTTVVSSPDDDVKRAEALDLLEKPFEALLQQLSPDLVIYDLMQHWVPRVAAKLPNPIPAILFLILGAAKFSYLEGQPDTTSGNPTAEELTVSPPGYPSPNIHLTLYEGRRAMELLYRKLADGLSLADRASICMGESWAVACNTCFELEGTYVEYLQSLVKRPVYPVGILMRKLPPLPVDDICLQWLDRQPAASVVVLSFGSEHVLSDQQLAAVAMGLQESNASFLWVLPAQNDLPQCFQR